MKHLPHAQLIEDCLRFCEETGIKPTVLGREAINDGNFLSRLRRGGRCWPDTEERVRDYMRKKLMLIANCGEQTATSTQAGVSAE